MKTREMVLQWVEENPLCNKETIVAHIKGKPSLLVRNVIADLFKENVLYCTRAGKIFIPVPINSAFKEIL
jgi:hypothetical protein